ncbi:hypothetical protein LCGC14_2169540 [marine sediment metagenome]|uniref:Uncharacterized protein n=1 Tax=marine sediment metagenome TaxID=412755 RepID=A0A0F9ECN8_9ZZZZ
MTPIKYTVKNGVTTFHYKFSELRNFVRLGLLHGDVGMILVCREGGLITYKGFGTIENPRRTIHTFSIMHLPVLDGEMPTDEEILIPPKPLFTEKNTSFMILDLSDSNKQEHVTT